MSCPALRRARVAPLLALALLLLFPATAVAHTGLVSSDPPDGAVVDARVDAVTLTFNAPVELLEDTLVARGPGGSRVLAAERIGRERLVVTAALDDPLPPGDWVLGWRVLASDSHPRTGEVAITVTDEGRAPEASAPGGGEAAAPAGEDAAEGRADAAAPVVGPDDGSEAASAEQDSSRWLERMGAFARVLFYLGLLTAAGLALFKAGPHAGQSVRARRLAGVALVAALVGLVSGLVEVALHVAAVSGKGVLGALHVPTWGSVLRTGLGPALLLRTVGLGLLAVGARRRVREGLPSAPDWRKLLGALVAIGSFQFVGHTASVAPEIVVRSADLVHAIAAAVWIGGLVGLTVTTRTADSRDRATTVARFSTWATFAVAGVTVAGTALAWVNLPTVAAAWQTGYGRVLLAKLVLVGVLLLLGAHNHLNVVPDVVEGSAAAAADLRRVVRWEMAIVGVVVVLTAVLVNLTPV